MSEPYVCSCCGGPTEIASADCDFCFVHCSDGRTYCGETGDSSDTGGDTE